LGSGLEDKIESSVLFGLTVEGGFEEMVVAFFVHVDEIGIGTGDDSFAIFER